MDSLATLVAGILGAAATIYAAILQSRRHQALSAPEEVQLKLEFGSDHPDLRNRPKAVAKKPNPRSTKDWTGTHAGEVRKIAFRGLELAF
ncbi:MAG: hypothetical protein NT069_01745 [Planctomycetota bacterium]|nr:hypothetical protein [Planctomycetota bacterium]